VIVGGPRRAWRAKEFIAALHYGAGQGSPPNGRALVKHAGGLVLAAAECRIRDLVRPGVSALDWLHVAPRTELTIAIVTLLGASHYARDGRGWVGVMSNMENVSAIAILIGGTLLWLRTWRRKRLIALEFQRDSRYFDFGGQSARQRGDLGGLRRGECARATEALAVGRTQQVLAGEALPPPTGASPSNVEDVRVLDWDRIRSCLSSRASSSERLR
jgi:hypothetical protein